MPPPWVWFIFLLSMIILGASMLTFQEGRRFISRDLDPREATLVNASLTLWENVQEPGEQIAIRVLRKRLAEGRLRAMSSLSFSRAQERSAFGYTDERGRILLNPRLCFPNMKYLRDSDQDPDDLVSTCSTLYHEACHLLWGASEACAYEREWLFLSRLRAWAEASGNRPLAEEVSVWEKSMPSRIELYVGPAVAEEIRVHRADLRSGRTPGPVEN